MHVHVQSDRGEAKFWIEPEIQLALNQGFTSKDIRIAQNLIEEHKDEIENAWHKHFGN